MNLRTTSYTCQVCRKSALGLESEKGTVFQLPAGWFGLEENTRGRPSLDYPQACSLECAAVIYAEREQG